MRLTGSLTRPTIKKYYATGSLQQKMENPALRKMLSKIKAGGMNAFLNDQELKQFAQGLKSSFESEGYLNTDADGSLTPAGEDIVSTGKAWRGLQGAFSLTVLEYQGKGYVLDAELVKDDKQKNVHANCPYKFDEEYTAVDGKELKEIRLDKNWAEYTQALQNPSVKFVYEYDADRCTVTASWKDGGKDSNVTFTTKDTSSFVIITKNTAMELLREREDGEGVFEFSHQDTTAIQIVARQADELQGKTWLHTFFERGHFSFENILLDRNEGVAKIEDVALYYRA